MDPQNWQGLGRISAVIWCVLCLSLLGSGQSQAQEPGHQEETAISQELQQWQVLAISPGVKVLSQSYSNPGKVLPSDKDPEEVAQDWLADKGMEEGRNFMQEKLLYLSVGSAAINAKPSDPGFIDSRYLAFQRAELMAKAKTAIFLGVDLTTERGSSEREINPEERAAMEDIVKASSTIQGNAKMMEIKDTIYGLFQKTKILAHAKLDKAIEEAGSEATDEQRKLERKKEAAKTKRDRSKRLRNISEASVKAAACAFADVQGTQTIQAFEGSFHGNYKVVVISLWSQNLQRMVDSMQRGIAPRGLPRKVAKEEVSKQLPKGPEELACLSGVRAYINQDGEHVLLSFGQAGVEVIGGREDKAYEVAGKKARLRAMAAMRTFMGEKVAFSNTEELMEVLALYAGELQGEGEQEYRSISQFQEKIQAVAKKQKITGIHGLLTKELTHPFTDKSMVLKVIAWSPSSQALSNQLKKDIEHGVASPKAVKSADSPPKEETPARKGLITSGEGADEDAW